MLFVRWGHLHGWQFLINHRSWMNETRLELYRGGATPLFLQRDRATMTNHRTDFVSKTARWNNQINYSSNKLTAQVKENDGENIIKHTPGHTGQLFFFYEMRRKSTRIIWFSDLWVKWLCAFLLLVKQVALATRLSRRYLSHKPRQKVSVFLKPFI